MNPITHFLVGWSVALIPAHATQRDRALIAFSSVVPDLDGFGLIPELLTRHTERPLFWWTDYHHVVGHNIGFALAAAIVVWLAANDRWTTALLSCLSFHLHLLGDIVGSRGPDGYQWPIPYLAPFSTTLQLRWDHQWALNAWPNILITLFLIVVALAVARVRGYSPVGLFSRRADAALIETIHNRFPLRAEQKN